MSKRLSLEFRKFDNPDLLEVAVERIRRISGVINIEPLFPGTEDAEEKAFYILEVIDTDEEHVLLNVEADPNVDSVFDPLADEI